MEDGVAGILFGLFCVVGGLFGAGLLVGWLAWGRRRPHQSTDATRNHRAWLAQQVDREPLRSVLTADQRTQVREIYGQGEAVRQSQPASLPTTPIATTADFSPGAGTPDQIDPLDGYDRPSIPSESSTEPPATPPKRTRDPLDPATLLLYAGAFLIAAAGVVYSAYNWADLVAWQKLVMLAALTLAFAIVGWFLLGNQRLKQAGETFVAIAAMLIPANAIAVWTVSQQSTASTGLIVMVGAALSAVAHGVFSVRPGGVAYTYGSPLFGWLALGAIPAATGLDWTWGVPLLIAGVGCVRLADEHLPAIVRHLNHSLYRTGLVATGLALAAAMLSEPEAGSWLPTVTAAALTFTLAAYASRSPRALWGMLTSFTGLLTLVFLGDRLVSLVDLFEQPAFTAPLLLGVGTVLVALGERGPIWLRRPAVRLTLQIESVFVLLIATVATGAEHWLRVAIVAGAIGITATIAWLRQNRWFTILPAVGIVGLGIALAVAIDPSLDWPMTARLVGLTVLAGVLGTVAWRLDRWSRHRQPSLWGEPVWIVAGITAVGTTALGLLNTDLRGQDQTWLVLAVVNVCFTLGTLMAMASTRRWWIGALAGGWAVTAAGSLAVWPDLIGADRLPLLLGTLSVFVTGCLAALRWRGFPSRASWWLLVVPVSVAILVLGGMVALTIRWVLSDGSSAWPGAVQAQWTGVIYTGVFALIVLLSGWLSFRKPHGLHRVEVLVESVATGVSAGLLSLTMLLMLRLATNDATILLISLLVLGWLVYGLAVAIERYPSLFEPSARWRLAAIAIAAGAVLGSSWLPDGEETFPNRTWLTATLVSLAGMLAAEGWTRRHRLILIAASGLGMFALLVQIGAREPGTILAYSLPLGVYLLGLGVVNRKAAHLRDILLGAGGGVLLLPALWLAQREGAVSYLLLAAGISLTSFVAGLLLRLRVLIAAGVLGLTVIVFRLLIDAVLALESWISLLAVGLVLLGSGTAALVWREQLKTRLERLQRGWHEMG